MVNMRDSNPRSSESLQKARGVNPRLTGEQVKGEGKYARGLRKMSI
jgi:hypothetical protein